MSRRQRGKYPNTGVPLVGSIVKVGSDDRDEYIRKVERTVAAFLDDLPPGTLAKDIDRHAMAEWLHLVVRAWTT